MHKDNNGWIPLHHAAVEGNAGACRLLCQKCRATLQQTDREGRHPLVLAAEEGHVETIKVLLSFSAPIDYPTLDGCTALRLAALNGHKSVCETLVHFGADTESLDIDGTTTLYALILHSYLDTAELFLQLGARTDLPDSHGRVPLHVAAWQGNSPAVELLQKYGGDVNAHDAEGRTPLMIALWQNKLATVKTLLDLRADAHAVCSQGATALSIACQEGNEDAVKMLLRYGADPEHRDNYGRTAQEVAAKAGHDRIVDLVERMSSLSPLSPRRTMNTNNSGGGSSDKTSGISSMFSSTDSQCHTGELRRRQLGAAVNLANVFHHNTSFGAQSCSPSDQFGASGSNKSTLSSCGTPEDDFARQLLERSLPRPHSRPVSMRFAATDIPLSFSMHEKINKSSNSSENNYSSQIYDSLSIGNKKRPNIATNPKCRKPKSPISPNPMQTTKDLTETTMKLNHLMRISSPNYQCSAR